MVRTNVAHEMFVTGLKNAHAMEVQALSIMERQLKSTDSYYPEIRSMLTLHIRQTEAQAARLEQILETISEGASSLKDMEKSVSGSLFAFARNLTEDGALKNTLSNYAFENYEIATYEMLIALASESQNTHVIRPLESSLDEEEKMAAWIKSSLLGTVSRHVDLADPDMPASITR